MIPLAPLLCRQRPPAALAARLAAMRLSAAPCAGRTRHGALCTSNSSYSTAQTLVGSSTALKGAAPPPLATRITTLPSGMRVATESMPGCQTATIGVWIDGGSRWEDASNNGTAHFLEHMAFKGTRSLSQTDLEVKVENMGGHLNAYTSREQTAFYAKVFAKDAPRAVAILADILLNATLDERAIERERDVILREQEEVAKQMEEVVFDHLHAVAFQDSSLGLTILGPEENIRSISKRDLTSYIRSTYAAPRMVLAAAGGIDHDEVVRLAGSAFAALGQPAAAEKASPPPPSAPTFAPAIYSGAEVRMRDDSMEQAHMVIAVQGASWTSADYFPLLVAQAIVGSWNRGLAGGHNVGSKLAQVVAKNNLALSFTSFNTSYSDTGLFGIYMVSDRIHGLDDLVYEVQQEWVRICMNATEGEVARAKTQLKASLLLSLDGTTPICEDIGRQILAYGKRYSWADLHAIIDRIDAATVRRVASDYLYDRDPAIVALGPIATFPDYTKIRAATLWLRS